MNESVELETQKQIYLLVSRQPGLNLSTIAELLGISIELARYHLGYLEKNELVASSKEGGYLRFYLKGKIGVRDKEFLSLFRQEMLLKIVLFLLKNPSSRHRDICSFFHMSRSLLSYYLKKLVKRGIIEAVGEGNERRYGVVNKDEIVRFLIKYEPYKILDGISETWKDFTFR
ncbi:MAG: winged helix-turn-helix transcriptional regulator [Methanobacteriota archaeon]